MLSEAVRVVRVVMQLTMRRVVGVGVGYAGGRSHRDEGGLGRVGP